MKNVRAPQEPYTSSNLTLCTEVKFPDPARRGPRWEVLVRYPALY